MKKEREKLFKDAAGSLAAVSSAILVLVAEGTIRTGGSIGYYLVLVSASIPLLLCFYVSHYECNECNECRPKAAELYMGLLFASGATCAFTGYVLLLAEASLFALFGFMIGLVLGLLGFYKVAKAETDAQPAVQSDGPASGGPVD